MGTGTIEANTPHGFTTARIWDFLAKVDEVTG